jgi:hypothetical protein
MLNASHSLTVMKGARVYREQLRIIPNARALGDF